MYISQKYIYLKYINHRNVSNIPINFYANYLLIIIKIFRKQICQILFQILL